MKLKRLFISLLTIVLPIATMSTAHGKPSPFDFTENSIEASPIKAQSLVLEPGEKVIHFDISPLRAEAALLVKTPSGRQKILFWNVGSQAPDTKTLEVPDTLQLSEIIWHPQGQAFFMLAKKGQQYEILKNTQASWHPVTIYHSSAPLSNLVAAPRPFEQGFDGATKTSPTSYRLFFGVKTGRDTYSTHTVTENGHKEYAVLNAESTPLALADSEFNLAYPETQPKVTAAISALPLAFHPAGHFMIWEDDKHCFQKLEYAKDNWHAASAVIQGKSLCGGRIAYTPNGAGLLQWQADVKGVTLYTDHGNQSSTLAREIQFLSAPLSVPDGKGLAGVVQQGASIAFQYVPVDMPLADVTNAWMFLESSQDLALLSKNTGLFRSLKDNQLYELYDSESYYCGNMDKSIPTRPYLVTTDIFLELYASAFEGLFVLSEKQAAIPAFWMFVQDANEQLKNQPDTPMAQVFATLIALKEGVKDHAEVNKILQAEGISPSTITGKPFHFGNLKPRSHYAADPTLQTYFRAFKYLTDLKLDKADIAQLHRLPKPVMQKALAWINVYRPFIAPSKRPLIWENATPIPDYVLHPDKQEQLFPLSWGMDNEILFSTVYHQNVPAAEQITGKQGPRLLPSGLDVAAVMGSSVAESILDTTGEFEKYPPLKNQLAFLRTRYHASKDTGSDSLYQQWLATLASQWTDASSSPGDTIQKALWSRKKLQTGLASFATLRHSTLLVNERTMAECGEAGFEPIILRPPRGYVEPDVKTLDAIANLFDASIKVVNMQKKNVPQLQGKQDQAIWEGVARRLLQSRDKVRLFRDIAKKEIAGEALTNKEYEEILYVGRAAEHNFLIFKSLAQKDFALSTPDPVGKVADVAADPQGRYLLVGVGSPMEWDQIVPFFGRKQVVKGAVYSYYEALTNQVMTDAQWRSRLIGMLHPAWIEPLISQAKLSCPAKAPS